LAYDEGLAERLRETLEAGFGCTEKRMFGGVAFMVNGHMALGVANDELMVRVGKDGWAEALAQPGAREMTFTGRSMKTMVFVDQSALETDQEVHDWIERALDFVLTLPPKD
jgi:TfoX/Sxy family transcriptional regulator of competence genes